VRKDVVKASVKVVLLVALAALAGLGGCAQPPPRCALRLSNSVSSQILDFRITNGGYKSRGVDVSSGVSKTQLDVLAVVAKRTVIEWRPEGAQPRSVDLVAAKAFECRDLGRTLEIEVGDAGITLAVRDREGAREYDVYRELFRFEDL
jgi:hypothetical protein